MRSELRILKNEPGPSMARGPAALEPRPVAVSRLDPEPAAPLEVAGVGATFNEGENVKELIARVERALRGISWEMIFVDDDSPDETSAEIKAIAARDSRIRCLRRIGPRRLSSD